MSGQSLRSWQDGYTSHHEDSLRNEYTRFACMFYVFSLFAFLSTILLFIFVNDAYHHESESVQRRFLPYCTLAAISLALFFIFFIGSLVYTSKSIRQSRLKQPTKSPIPPPRSTEPSTRTTKPFPLSTDVVSGASTKTPVEQKSKATNASARHFQTDV